jgi:hypothetical protein
VLTQGTEARLIYVVAAYSESIVSWYILATTARLSFSVGPENSTQNNQQGRRSILTTEVCKSLFANWHFNNPQLHNQYVSSTICSTGAADPFINIHKQPIIIPADKATVQDSS